MPSLGLSPILLKTCLKITTSISASVEENLTEFRFFFKVFSYEFTNVMNFNH